MASPKPHLMVALDMASLDRMRELVDTLDEKVEWYKVGKQLFTRFGPEPVKILKARGRNVFLDLKFHDIPNTVAHAVQSAADIGADMVNVHAGGGDAMLRAAARAGTDNGILVVAVTVLTSLDDEALRAAGIHDTAEKQVVRLARLAQNAGLPGVVCSGREIPLLRQECGPKFQLVVPGIRPAGTAHGDQKRVMTPADAARQGADYIVVGRPIREADDPLRAAEDVLKELKIAGNRGWKRAPGSSHGQQTG